MNKNLRRGLVLGALTFAAVMGLNLGAAPAQVARAQGPDRENAVVAWDTDGNNVSKKAFLGTTNNKPFVLKTNSAERMRVTQDGKVGIGTTNPLSKLHVVSGSADGSPPRLQSDGTTGFGAGWDFYHGATGKGYVGVPDSAASIGPGELLVFGGPGTKTSLWAGGNRSVTLNTNGRVGIQTTNPGATLDVGSGRLRLSDPTGLGDIEFTEAVDVIAFTTNANPTPTDAAFRVDTGTGLTNVFTVRNDGVTQIGALDGTSTTQACLQANLTFAACSSAAEYVPTIDGGKGYPQTAELVSIAPAVKNPYGDAHGPFTVQKTTTACDSNLLGYMVKPESGANGVKLNDHYMPLAIFGYFPAKVTTENGAIKRGDPITSSSKAGYGMKATGACKVIGYALEDATTDGTIQVFANLGDNSAAQVQELQQENAALKQMLMKFEARLAVLEHTATPNTAVAAVVR